MDLSRLLKIGHLKKAAIITFIGIIFSKFFAYVYRLIVARLGPTDYGTFSLGYAIYGFALIFAMLGLSQAVLRYIPYYRANKDTGNEHGTLKTSLVIMLVSSLLFSGLLFAFADYFANLFRTPDLALVIRFFAIALPFAALGMLLVSVLKAYKKVAQATLPQYYIEGIAKIILTALLLWLGYGLLGAIGGFISAVIIMFLAAAWLSRKYLFRKGAWVAKELLPYSVTLMFSGFLYYIIYYTDSLMVGYYKDAAQVGIYNVSLPTAGLLFIIPEAILVLFVPLMTEYYAKGNKAKFYDLYRKSFWYSLLFNLPVFLVLFFFSKIVIQLLFGSAYVPGALALSILSIGYFFRLVFMPHTRLLEVFKKQKVLLVITIIAALMNVAINFVLIPAYGIVGGAISTTITYVFIGLSTLWFSSKYVRIFVGKA